MVMATGTLRSTGNSECATYLYFTNVQKKKQKEADLRQNISFFFENKMSIRITLG
jgi:hypothetical protein